MPEDLKKAVESLWQWVTDVLIPAIAALSVRISIQMKTTSVKTSQIIFSVIIGISLSYICGGFILKHFSRDISVILISLITITGEKVAHWFVYSFDFDPIGKAFTGWIKNKFK